MMRHITAILCASAALLGGCAKGNLNSGKSEEKPVLNGGNSNPTQEKKQAKPIISGNYFVTVDQYERLDGTQPQNLCKGNATVVIWDDMRFKPSGFLDCMMVGKIELGKFFISPSEFEPLDGTKYDGAEYFSRMPNPAAGSQGAFFTPPRPMVLGPIIQDPNFYNNYRYVDAKDTHVRLVTPQGTVESDGKFLIEVKNINTSFQPQGSTTRYENVIEWEMRTSGFMNFPKMQANLADRWEWWWRVKPISIPQMKLHTTLGQLMPGQPLSKLGDAFFGPVIITLSLVDESRL